MRHLNHSQILYIFSAAAFATFLKSVSRDIITLTFVDKIKLELCISCLIFTAFPSTYIVLNKRYENQLTIHKIFTFSGDGFRVSKCHGYGRYIRVKILEGWGNI